MKKSILPSPIKFFSNLEQEHDFKEVSVEGEIPGELHGVLFRNGAGVFEQFGRRYQHVFECDGAISALKIKNQKAYFSTKVIETDGLKEERDKKRNLYGSRAPWPARFLKRFKGHEKNVANTHIVPWQKKLYALMEGGKPTEIDKESLRSLGESTLGGVVQGNFSAHPHYIAKRRALYNFGLEYGKETKLHIYELPDNRTAKRIGTVSLDRPIILHDFIATQNYLIFFIAPIALNLPRVLLSIGSFSDVLQWQENLGTEVILVPLDDPQNAVRFHTEAFVATHFSNAYEDEDGNITVDYIHNKDDKLFHYLKDGSELGWEEDTNHPHGILHRAVINPRKKSFSTRPRWPGFCEFPRFNEKMAGEKYNFCWMQIEQYVDGIYTSGVCKINEAGEVKSFLSERGQLCSEPVPVLTGNAEDDGYVMVLVFDSKVNKSHFLILTAQDLTFQAKIVLDQVIPITFHGSWVKDFEMS